MNRQDTSPISANGETTDQVDRSESTSLGRRRALLSGLGKGGAIVAVVAPVSSFAAGRVRTADGKQCTVSGQMSAVMSQAASALSCAAYHPTYFFTASAYKKYQDWNNGTTGQTAANFQNALKNMAAGTYFLDGNNAVYFKRAADNLIRQLTPANRPLNYAAVSLTALAILTDASNDWVLKVLHSASESDTAYFLAAFFSALLAAPTGAEKVPFPATDVQAQWTGGKKIEAAALYRLICTLGKDTNKLG